MRGEQNERKTDPPVLEEQRVGQAVDERDKVVASIVRDEEARVLVAIEAARAVRRAPRFERDAQARKLDAIDGE